MARTVASSPAGSRITNYVGLGAIAKSLPLQKANAVLRDFCKTGVRQRDLPAHVAEDS